MLKSFILYYMAVRVGFEPTEESPPQRFSRPPDSTTLAPHRAGGLAGLLILYRTRAAYCARAFSMAAVTSGESGVTFDGNRATIRPSRPITNFVKFHSISPPVSRVRYW